MADYIFVILQFFLKEGPQIIKALYYPKLDNVNKMLFAEDIVQILISRSF